MYRVTYSVACCILRSSSPACTELEVVVTNWLGTMIGLPQSFLHPLPAFSEGGEREARNIIQNTVLGGGVIQGSAGEAAVVCMLAARERVLQVGYDDWCCISMRECAKAFLWVLVLRISMVKSASVLSVVLLFISPIRLIPQFVRHDAPVLCTNSRSY